MSMGPFDRAWRMSLKSFLRNRTSYLSAMACMRVWKFSVTSLTVSSLAAGVASNEDLSSQGRIVFLRINDVGKTFLCNVRSVSNGRVAGR